MKSLYTSVDIKPSGSKIGYNDKILLLGSCFADNIGEKFTEHYFQATINPYGTLYNPASIARAVGGFRGEIVEWGGLWHSTMHHGCLSGAEKDIVEANCQAAEKLLQEAVREADVVVVTFGTAWVYEMDGEVVANCHKMPANRFLRRCLTVEEIVELWEPIIMRMPDKHWIFTVSPIRHVKDGLHANQISKAILLQAIDNLISSLSLQASKLDYFPSYEIMMDELRDYRFYAEDLVHPSKMAVDYIWERFVDTYMTVDTKNEMRILYQLWLDRHHRFLHPETAEAKAFAERIEKRKNELKSQYHWLK
jgi:hypothetical protein